MEDQKNIAVIFYSADNAMYAVQYTYPVSYTHLDVYKRQEVARKDKDIVYFREMIESENFQKAESKLSVTLGKNIGGECVVADLTKMPHLLIAGTCLLYTSGCV